MEEDDILDLHGKVALFRHGSDVEEGSDRAGDGWRRPCQRDQISSGQACFATWSYVQARSSSTCAGGFGVRLF
jgi:hypothetical protein